MSTLRDSLQSPHWRSLYTWGSESPQSKYYSKTSYNDGGFVPLVIDANQQTSTQMQRGGKYVYSIGAVSPSLQQRNVMGEINGCVDHTHDPNYCTRHIGEVASTMSGSLYQRL